MTEKATAARLYEITADQIGRAIDDVRNSRKSHDFADSTVFDLLVDPKTRLPPKAVVGVAAEQAFGQVLSNKQFSGGESSSAFRLLWMRGFEIVTKKRTIGALDAEFSVGRNSDSLFVIYESMGGGYRTDYLVGLESLLSQLANLDASLASVAIDTGDTQKLSQSERLLNLPNRYPIRLRDVTDLGAFRRSLTAAAATTGSHKKLASSGNPTKRLRLEILVPGDFTLRELSDVLGEESAASLDREVECRFEPRPPGPARGPGVRNAIEETVITQDHSAMQEVLYHDLAADFGVENVSTEQVTKSGRPADIVVRRDDGLFDIYEIKTALAPRDCVRQAIGQLLEYALWPGS